MRARYRPDVMRLDFGKGDDAFTLLVKPPGGSDRFLILDAIGSGSIALAFTALGRLVCGWEGVCDGDGKPIEFSPAQENGHGASRFDWFAGMLPVVVQKAVFESLLRVAGLDFAAASKVVGIDAGQAVRPGGASNG